MLTQAEAEALAADLKSADVERRKLAQRRLGVTDDGKPGPLTFTALLCAWPASAPVARMPAAAWSYKTGARKFGASRSGGKRAHAGVDLYKPKGTNVRAVADGVVRRVAYFYNETWAVEVDHFGFTARYGEVAPNPPVRVGQRVRRGQVVGEVGHLEGIKVPSDMLHLELYMGTRTGALTVKAADGGTLNGRPTLRRRDLLDPTPILDVWRQTLPTP